MSCSLEEFVEKWIGEYCERFEFYDGKPGEITHNPPVRIVFGQNATVWGMNKFAQAVAEFVRGEKKKCRWVLEDDWDYPNWNTACGQSFVFENGGPKENDCKFCPFCGGILVIEQLKAKKDGGKDGN